MPPPIANAFDTGPDGAPVLLAASAGAAPAAWSAVTANATETNAHSQRGTAPTAIRRARDASMMMVLIRLPSSDRLLGGWG